MLGRRAYVSAVAEMLNATFAKETIALDCGLNGVEGATHSTCTPTTVGPVTVPSIGVEAGF
ncbi:MAG TPA: hypothetical protein VHB21_00410 [Minicystis sp.]|nr:hypothetical protein [Minicystis sp.]